MNVLDNDIDLGRPAVVAGAIYKYYPWGDESGDSTEEMSDQALWDEFSPVDTLYKTDQTVRQRVGAVLMNMTVLTEVSPLNGPLRYGLCFGGTLAATGNSLAAAGAMMVSTAMLEGGAALASSSLLVDGGQDNAAVAVRNLLDHKVVKNILPNKIKMSGPVQAVVAMYLGTSILLSLQQRERPSISQEELRRSGLLTTSWLAPFCGVHSYLLAQGVTSLEDPKVMVPSLAGFGMIATGLAWLKRKIRQTSENSESPEAVAA